MGLFPLVSKLFFQNAPQRIILSDFQVRSKYHKFGIPIL
ncbi:hypothetical protein PMIT1323_00901 [Prochlorococcus marinus str. MIT 1323]|nr:hypothetical protein PMIT1323_00901 [Prochlorococcus marinus str. MIT 1323]